MEAAAPAPHIPRKQEGGFIAKLGAWLQLAQILGMLGTIIGMTRAFDTLTTDGAGDPARLSGAIGEMLIFTLAGVVLSLAGVVLVIVAVTAFRYRAMWMYYFLWCYGILSLGAEAWVAFHRLPFLLGYHAPFGLFFVLFAVMKRQEFLQAGVRDALARYVLEE